MSTLESTEDHEPEPLPPIPEREPLRPTTLPLLLHVSASITMYPIPTPPAPTDESIENIGIIDQAASLPPAASDSRQRSRKAVIATSLLLLVWSAAVLAAFYLGD
jgi:hypothetical protein